MKKRLACLLGAFSLALTLCACGDPTTVDYNGKTYDDLETEMTSYVSKVSDFYSQFTSYLEENSLDMSIDDYLTDEAIEYYEENYSLTEEELLAYKSFGETAETYGAYTGTVENSFKANKSGKTTTTDCTLIFTDDNGKTKDVTFEIVYESWSMEITGITIEPVKSMGEKMSNAGLNTLISMCIVFLVLILISLIIYAFNIFPYLEKRKKEKALKKTEENAQGQMPADTMTAQAAASQPAVNQADDLELVAVIAAAIAASEGCSTSDFVVRSINRR